MYEPAVFGAVAVLTARDCRARLEGHSSSPRAWAGTARHPVGGGRSRAHRRTRGLASCALRGVFISAIGRVSRGLTGRTGDHPGLKNPCSTGPTDCLARIRSTGSRRGVTLPGWRGCPTPAVSPRSTGFRGGAAVSPPSTGSRQVGEVAQLRRYLPAQLVTVEDVTRQVGEVAQLRRYPPAQLVPIEDQTFQVGEVAQQLNWLELRSRNWLARLPSSGGISPLNWLAARGQPFQVGEVAQLRRYLPAQLVPALAEVPARLVPVEVSRVRLARLPSSGGIPPLNWFPEDQSSRLAAQLRRYPPLRLARLVGEVANSGGISPLNWFSAEVQQFQVGEVAQLRRYLPAQLVRGELQPFQVARLPNHGGISPLNWL